MPENFIAQPNAPMTRQDGYPSQSWSGYFNNLDLVESGVLLGRWSSTVGPTQWVTLGAGLSLSAAGVLDVTAHPTFDSLTVGISGASVELAAIPDLASSVGVTAGATIGVMRAYDPAFAEPDLAGQTAFGAVGSTIIYSGIAAQSGGPETLSLRAGGYAAAAEQVAVSKDGVGIRQAPSATSILAVTGLPTSAAGLSAGDVWCDTGAGNVLKVV